MSAQRTPGPWILGPWSDGGRTIVGPRGAGFQARVIAHVFSGIGDDRLIVGAPELLSAGQAMVDDHQTSEAHHPNYVLVTRAAFEAMRAAVAKATGVA